MADLFHGQDSSSQAPWLEGVQAIVEGITLLTADIQVAKYTGPVQRV